MYLCQDTPERFSSVEKLCINQGYSLGKRSENTVVTEQDIWLLDTLGELMPTYALADIITMGGSFSNIGGHNPPLEPALFKKPIIVGHDMHNFTEILTQLKQNNGVIQLPIACNSISNTLAETVINLLENKNAAFELGSQAHNVVLNNQGASDKTLAQVHDLLK